MSGGQSGQFAFQAAETSLNTLPNKHLQHDTARNNSTTTIRKTKRETFLQGGQSVNLHRFPSETVPFRIWT